jgi:hypothetical protein
MVRRILSLAIALAFPAVVAGQAPRASVPHGIARQVMGSVAASHALLHTATVPARSEVKGSGKADADNDVNEVDGQNNDKDDGDVKEGNDVEQEGNDVDEPKGTNNATKDEGEHVSQGGTEQDQNDDTPAPPASASRQGRAGRHKP